MAGIKHENAAASSDGEPQTTALEIEDGRSG